mmetsp:Transcript_6293/g.17092  ORF Transcript_6293/g.17092 Transcript_6293/m.17092 type:complete len:204 (+) Transcript_6293:485-1096(+)
MDDAAPPPAARLVLVVCGQRLGDGDWNASCNISGWIPVKVVNDLHIGHGEGDLLFHERVLALLIDLLLAGEEEDALEGLVDEEVVERPQPVDLELFFLEGVDVAVRQGDDVVDGGPHVHEEVGCLAGCELVELPVDVGPHHAVLELGELIRRDVREVVVRKAGLQGEDEVRHELAGGQLREVAERCFGTRSPRRIVKRPRASA